MSAAMKLDHDAYVEILSAVLSRFGMRRFLNGDSIELDPSDYREIMDRAYAFRTPPQGELSALPDLDQLALDTATKILPMYFETIPGSQLKAKIQCAVHEALESVCRQSGDAADKRDAALDALAEQFPQPYMEYFGSDIQDAIKTKG